MNLLETKLLGLVLVVFCFLLLFLFVLLERRKIALGLREVSVFNKLRRGIGLAVEAGSRLHVSLGSGGVQGVRGTSALVGLSVLQRIARVASVSDLPPIATSGEASLSILSQDTLQSTYRSISASSQYDPASGQLTGLTPFSYAAGALPVIFDQQVSINILAGNFGSEVALLADAAERAGSLTLGGSDNISAQAILYSMAQEPLVGEELYASGAYIHGHPFHIASLRLQDVIRWLLIAMILVGAVLKLIGVL